jgi:hypothetical protein
MDETVSTEHQGRFVSPCAEVDPAEVSENELGPQQRPQVRVEIFAQTIDRSGGNTGIRIENEHIPTLGRSGDRVLVCAEAGAPWLEDPPTSE